MTDYEDDFFEGKRTWSIIKDDVLRSYLPPYLSKVKLLQKKILLVDGFAGPGIFDDGSEGSPLIICRAAQEQLRGKYQAFFINRKKTYHDLLEMNLRKGGWLNSSTPVLGDTTKIIPVLPRVLLDHTVFLYLDPFGPTGCPFSLLEPFLTRRRDYSTEIVIMMHMPIAHRLAARKAIEAGKGNDATIQTYHQTMTKIFGGDYWKPIMLSPKLSVEEKDHQLIEAYRRKLAVYLPFTGSCPVKERESARIKYFIVFASRHSDAMLLMHDAMLKSYHKRMHEEMYAGTLFEGVNEWTELLNTRGLKEEIIKEVKSCPGISREDLWLKIVQHQFMRYRRTDFLASIQELVDQGEITCPTPKKTKRLNENCIFYCT